MNLFFLLSEGSQGATTVKLWDIVVTKSSGAGLVVNITLLLMLGYVIFIFVQRFLAINRAKSDTYNQLATDIAMALMKNEQANTDPNTDPKISGLLNKSDDQKTPFEAILIDAITVHKNNKDVNKMRKAIESQGKLQISKLEQKLNVLATAAGAAPMIGFLGTVLGMMIVFIDLENSATLDLKVIAPGIMTAMVTTVGGLIVGIISYMSYNYLVGKIGDIIYKMEAASDKFLSNFN